MSRAETAENQAIQARIASLFENSPPVLVEVRFPNSATSPDWHLCYDEEQWDRLWERLGPGAELHLSSVWDLKSTKKEICLRK